MEEGVVDAGAVFASGDEAARFAHGLFYFRDGVGGTGGHGGITAIEHGNVVVMIARGENVLTRDMEEARQLGQSGSLVIVAVTKAQINGIPLIAKGGLAKPSL